MDIDTLWQVDLVRKRTPHWTYNWRDLDPVAEDDEMDSEFKPRINGPSSRLQITGGGNFDDGYASGDSMPGLLDVSDTEDEDDEDEDISQGSDEDSDSDGNEEDYETETDGYDSDEEEELRKMYRRAMTSYAENPEIFDTVAAEIDKYSNERKSNPFLRLLGNLKGAATPYISLVQRKLIVL